MKVKEEYIKKMDKTLKDLKYSQKVKKIILLRKQLEDFPENNELKRELYDLEYIIKLTNLRCEALSDLELTVISYAYFKKDKYYSFNQIANIIGYSISTAYRIKNRALANLAYFYFGDEFDIYE